MAVKRSSLARAAASAVDRWHPRLSDDRLRPAPIGRALTNSAQSGTADCFGPRHHEPALALLKASGGLPHSTILAGRFVMPRVEPIGGLPSSRHIPSI